MKYQNSKNLQALGIDEKDPEVMGRVWNNHKGTFKSHARDPWMKSSFRIDPAFLGWLREEKKRVFGEDPGLANLQAEIRNDFVRAGDLWDDYQASLLDKAEVNRENIALKNNDYLQGFVSLESLKNWENNQRISLKEMFC